MLEHYSFISRFLNQPYSIGLIAQEVSDVVPEAFSLETVIDNTTQYFQLVYDRFIPLLIEGMKEQQKQLEKLKEENKWFKSIICQDHPKTAICE